MNQPSFIARRRPSPAGFTLVELLIAVGIFGILAAIAVPAINDYVVNARLSSQTNELLSDLAAARTEASTRGRRVTICVSTSGTACDAAGSAWTNGRILFVDADGDGVFDSGEAKIRTGPPVVRPSTLVSAQFDPCISFLPYGGVGTAGACASTSGTFTVCSPGSPNGRTVTVAATGRATIARTACP